MKIYIHTDIEGVAGYCFHEDRLVGEQAKLDHVYRMRRLFTGEVNAAIETLVECGAEEVVVNDAHGNCNNLFFEDFPSAAKLIHGPATRMPMWLPCIDETFDAMICIGQHAMAGTNGVLPHSKYEITCGDHKNIVLNETGVAMLLASHFNVPTIMVSGDTTLCRQIKVLVPDIETVAVKVPLSPYNAMTVSPKKSRQMIRDGIKEAVGGMDKIEPYRISPPPYNITLTGATPGFNQKSEVFEAGTVYELIKKALCTIYDYELYDEKVWPLVPRGELILNKHERAYKKKLESEGKQYKPYIV